MAEGNILTDIYANSAIYKVKDTAAIENTDGSVQTLNLADEAVVEDKIANNAVTSDKVEDRAITTDKIGLKAITPELLDQSVYDALYPIGTYYWSANSTSPSQLFGGSWERITDKFVYACGTKSVDSTGGEEAHTITLDETPAHAHGMSNHTHSVGAHAHGLNNHTHWFTWTASHNHPSSTDSSMGACGYVGGVGERVRFSRASLDYWTIGANSKDGLGFLGSTGYTSLTIAGNTGGSSANTANSSAFNSGGPSTANTANSGGGVAHNNMPPYVVAYCWKRIA